MPKEPIFIKMAINRMDTYTKFLNNPISGMLFICLTAIGYLYVDSRNQFMKQITEIREENKTLKNENVFKNYVR